MRNPDADLHGFERLRLVGDEDCGVGLECRDCWDGGRPLAYLRSYPGDTTYQHDPKVSVVDDLAALLAVGRGHLDGHLRDTPARAELAPTADDELEPLAEMETQRDEARADRDRLAAQVAHYQRVVAAAQALRASQRRDALPPGTTVHDLLAAVEAFRPVREAFETAVDVLPDADTDQTEEPDVHL